MLNNFKKGKKGFVVLFTVLIAAVTLAMAVGISNIALKQIILSASATDANKSFYAADSGVDCALFYDLKQPSFITGAFSTISCGGDSIPVGDSGFGLFEEFPVSVGLNNDSCAYVTVDKSTPLTRITSKGVNVPCGTTNSRLVERVIEVTY